MAESAAFWIRHLGLKAHPEGGYFRETYRSAEFVQKRGLPKRYSSFRSFSTSIYFLLERGQFSAFHRLKSDEGWHFYKGAPINIYILFPNGKLHQVSLGADPVKKELFQITIPRGTWFAAEPTGARPYSLIGCTVAPGFDFDDFEMAKQDALLKAFPQHQNIIRKFSRPGSAG